MTTDRLVEIIEDAGYKTRSYSGCGMYGKQCLGITIGNDNGIVFAADVMASVDDANEREELLEFFSYGNVMVDSMMLGSIVYFPRVRFDKQE